MARVVFRSRSATVTAGPELRIELTGTSPEGDVTANELYEALPGIESMFDNLEYEISEGLKQQVLSTLRNRTKRAQETSEESRKEALRLRSRNKKLEIENKALRKELQKCKSSH